MSRLFTSESVTEGHPDKVADSVSDHVLDALLRDDHRSRVAVETLVTTGTVVVAGEVTTTAYADIANGQYQEWARFVLREVRIEDIRGWMLNTAVNLPVDGESIFFADRVRWK